MFTLITFFDSFCRAIKKAFGPSKILNGELIGVEITGPLDSITWDEIRAFTAIIQYLIFQHGGTAGDLSNIARKPDGIIKATLTVKAEDGFSPISVGSFARGGLRRYWSIPGKMRTCEVTFTIMSIFDCETKDGTRYADIEGPNGRLFDRRTEAAEKIIKNLTRA